MTVSRLRAGILAVPAVFALFVGRAAAIDPDAAAKALAAALAGGESGVRFDEASQQGADIVIEGLAFAQPDGTGAIRFSRTVIASPQESGGRFTAPSVLMSEGTLSGEASGTIVSATLRNVAFGAADQTGAGAAAPRLLYESGEAVDIKVRPQDLPADISVGRVTVEARNVVDGVPQQSTGKVEAIVLPPELFQDAGVTPQMLGYDRVTLDVTWDVGRDPQSDIVTVSDFTIGMAGGGRLAFTGEVGNVPAPAALGTADPAAVAAGLTVRSLMLRYEDQSLVGRILDAQAKRQGVSREQYVQQLGAALPFLLNALGNPQFQDQIATALGSFLSEPESLTIRAEPEKPISGAQLLATAGTAPQTLPDQLKVTVTANTPQ